MWSDDDDGSQWGIQSCIPGLVGEALGDLGGGPCSS